ncbi:hypothetical protein CC80DRAFT_292237 [Byssothecium circinans]|uniref:Uncharacterized protein n=1 Tax=Byssothecium circinans TaxID=147558 RepID=A0A6A5U631_9PLEO|nr:hypothetical protein CC80DRAFT_292237 [Byssothecium circinans]
MMKLYDSMLGKSDATKGHRRAEAATYFKFVIDHGERFIWHHIRHGGARCFSGGLENLVPFYEKYHGKTQPKNLPSILRQRVNFLCAGIVVVEEPLIFGPGLGFFHRTARDFFHEPSATEILQQCKLTELESYCLFVDAVSRHRHSKCRFLQHINEAMSRVHAMKNGGFNENWVYDQAKLDLGDDRVLDFVTLTFQAGSTELLSHSLSMKRSLSGRYKDYLLLCSSDHAFAPAWRQKFLELGANPNATFYWGLQDRLKTSPWLQYLVSTTECYKADGSDEDDYDDLPNNDLDMDTINAFLDNGASLEDRTVLLKCCSRIEPSLDDVESRELPPRSWRDLYDGMFFVIEVNAKYLLEEQCRPGRVRFSARRTEVLSRPDVQQSQSHRQVLLVHPGYSTEDLHPGTPSEDSEEESLGEPVPGELGLEVNNSGDARDNSTVGSPGKLQPPPFAEIDFRDSERLLDELELVPHLGQRNLSGEVFDRKDEEALGMWQRCPKVQDFKQYLEDNGYYKKADDPAVPQGPIPMFEDEE